MSAPLDDIASYSAWVYALAERHDFVTHSTLTLLPIGATLAKLEGRIECSGTVLMVTVLVVAQPAASIIAIAAVAGNNKRDMLIPLTPVASFSRSRLGLCEPPSPIMFGMQPSGSSGG